jgi:hypothetical protein
MRAMRYRLIVLAAVFAIGTSGHLRAAQDPDPVLGTWVLDVAQSTFSPGPPNRSQTRTYEQTKDGVRFVLTSIGASGAVTRVEYTARYDGKDYPLTGSPSSDSVSMTMIDRWTVDAVEKKAGKPSFHVTRVISKDGKTMTVTSSGTNANGVAIRNVLVFERAAAR